MRLIYPNYLTCKNNNGDRMAAIAYYVVKKLCDITF